MSGRAPSRPGGRDPELAPTAAGAAAVLASAGGLLEVFDSAAFVPAAVLAVVLVALVAAVCRAVGAPWAAAPAGVAALLVLAVVLVVPGTGVLGVLPGPTALASLRSVLRDGLEEVARLPLPVPATPGLVLLAAGGLGLVAVAVDLLAATLRRPALAGAPLLAVVVVLLAVLPDLPAWAFVLAAGGYLPLLLAGGSARSTGWGDRVPALPGAAGATGRAAAGVALAARVGVLALALGLLVPLLLPAATTGALAGDGSGRGIGAGSRSITTTNPIVDLQDELTLPTPRTLLQVRSSDPSAYLRLVVLEDFDGDSWRQRRLSADRGQRVDEDIPLPEGVAEEASLRTVRVDVTSVGLDVPWLPVVAPPTAVQVEGDWRYDAPTRTVFSTRTTTDELRWSQVARVPEPDPRALGARGDPSAGLPDDDYERLVALPDVSGAVAAEAARVTAGAASPYEQAVALQSYLRSDVFRYDEEALQGNGGDRVEGFLSPEGRVGYCEQFAAAFAVMGRHLGLATRLAVGYLPTETDPSGAYAVTTDQAHAWPEVWFDGLGWVAFEPTPARDAVVPSYAAPAPRAPADPPRPGDAQELPEAAAPQSAGDPLAARRGQDPASVADPAAVGEGAGQTGLPGLLAAALLALAVLALALVPAVVRVVRVRRRSATPPGRDRVAAAWAEVADTAADLGAPLPQGATPRGALHVLHGRHAVGRATAAALSDLALAEERRRYAPPSVAPGEVVDPGRLRAALLRPATGVQRARAVLLPRSVWSHLHPDALRARARQVVGRMTASSRRDVRGDRAAPDEAGPRAQAADRAPAGVR